MNVVATLAALVSAAAAPARQPLCEPSPEVQRAIEEVAPSAIAHDDLERTSGALRALRERFPGDLFVHLRLQDAVFDGGTEGNLKSMLREYQLLAADHPDDTLYEYLAGRAHLGRGTRKAIAAMERILERDPGFAPALRTLAEIHGSAMFRDAAKERREREAFGPLCPGSRIAQRPSPVPERSPVFDLREATPAQIGRALQADHARLMRIRLFDWYGEERKAEELRAVHADAWKAWRLLVEHDRRVGELARADALLAEMEERLVRLREHKDPLHSFAAGIVLALRAPSASRSLDPR